MISKHKGKYLITGIGIIILLTCILQVSGFAGNEGLRGSVALETRGTFGFIIQHHLDMGNYTTKHFSCFEMNLQKRVSGSKSWHHGYKMPSFGVSYWYSDLGKTKILGDVHALFYWGRFPLKRMKSSTFSIRFGAGLGYFNKTFDRYENYKNLAIGSHFNANLQLQLEYRVCFIKNTELAVTAGLAHFSNGTMKTPNYGINIPSTGLVFTWNKRMKDSIRYYQPEPFHRHYFIQISFSNGIKEILPVLGDKYWVFAASAEYIYQNSPVGGIGGGLDIFWDGSERKILERTRQLKTNDAGLLKPGLKAIKSWNMGNLNLNVELGIYLWEKEKSDGAIYDKIVMQYFVTHHVYTTLFLKTHYARADFIGWGIGMQLKNEN